MFHLVNNDLPWQMEFTVMPINSVVTKNRQTFKPLHPHSAAQNQSPLFIETNITAIAVTLWIQRTYLQKSHDWNTLFIIKFHSKVQDLYNIKFEIHVIFWLKPSHYILRGMARCLSAVQLLWNRQKLKCNNHSLASICFSSVTEILIPIQIRNKWYLSHRP
jgi:hypothetical protein